VKWGESVKKNFPSKFRIEPVSSHPSSVWNAWSDWWNRLGRSKFRIARFISGAGNRMIGCIFSLWFQGHRSDITTGSFLDPYGIHHRSYGRRKDVSKRVKSMMRENSANMTEYLRGHMANPRRLRRVLWEWEASGPDIHRRSRYPKQWRERHDRRAMSFLDVGRSDPSETLPKIRIEKNTLKRKSMNQSINPELRNCHGPQGSQFWIGIRPYPYLLTQASEMRKFSFSYSKQFILTQRDENRA
jgi:hypothetical protein